MDKFQPEKQSKQEPSKLLAQELAEELVTVHIDGKPWQLPKGENLLAAILSQKLNLPYFCWHPSMGSIGACRQCAVTLFADQEQQRGKTIMACMTPVADGMYLGLNHEPAVEFREQVISAMMTNHPHDCPVCGEGGACHLQDMTVMTGHSHRRYQGQKRTFTNQYLGPLVNHEMNRCITCYRCERFYKDYAGGKDFAACGSKNQVYFGRQQDGVLESEFAGNLVEVCPTGVFTDKPFASHYTRKWDLQSSPSICHGCSVGCNISVGERYGSVRRVINRYFDDINGYFICDKGRFGFAYVNSEDRVQRLDGVDLARAFARHEFSIAMAKHKSSAYLGIGSTRASLESNAALKQLVGAENFCSGLTEQQLASLRSCQALMLNNRQASIKDIEQSDCIIVLDEDLTQTSARIALAVRQASRNAAFKRAEQMGIPRWQDDAVRTAAQDLRSDLYLLQSKSSKLDDCAVFAAPMSPKNILAIAKSLLAALQSMDADNSTAVASNSNRTDLDENEQSLLDSIKLSLQNAKRPLIIGGCSHWQTELLATIEKIAANAPDNWQFALLPDAPNAMGLIGLIDEHTLSLEQLVERDLGNTMLICMENSLTMLTNAQKQDLASRAEKLLVIDHCHHQLVELADIVLPSTPFTESDGVIVNYMGLAQPFYAAKPQVQPLHMGWQWCRLLDDVIGNGIFNELDKLSHLRAFLAKQEPGFPDMSQLLAEQLIFKSARQPMRYSGRTAMIANQTVHEPKNPIDTDSPYSFSMEGPGKSDDRGHTLPKPFSWAPGWNSNQSVSKYQIRVSGPIAERQALFSVAGNFTYALETETTPSSANSKTIETKINGITIRKLEHLFANDELTDKVAEFRLMSPPPCLVVHVNDVSELAADNPEYISIDLIDNTSLVVQLIACEDIARGLAYLHHPSMNRENLLQQIRGVSNVTAADIESHKQQLKENLQYILEQKNRDLQRLQKNDQSIPIQFVGEGR
ncbi:NADH-quinone oxidoreductase subunit NuoG [Thalassotalea sp. PS06]|uniref:NADH-quinone oxidoreductase subunit NuoG n=1 Tax=Thalassotalea sp. PS06 TaxID=2594005 RepID=UPI0011626CFE|nr:NADH-quinone oxidoreductase subunit NuoG [Thalassotalea sp. PS06]QDP00856.1 NADH-quinone oxidoreductase subunit NuoG [Thalassotalea sp. PS06]